MAEVEFEYNDEFFLDEAQRREASAQFSEIWFALNPEHMHLAFRDHDKAAQDLKATFQVWGFRVVAMSVFALSVAVVEPIFIEPAVEHGYIPSAVGELTIAIAGLAGICSVLMGYFGMGFSGRKAQWLQSRMHCERMRQWRWQYFCAHIREILQASTDEKLQGSYITKRDLAFTHVVANLQTAGSTRLHDVLSRKGDAPDAVWTQAEFKSKIQHIHASRALEAPTAQQQRPAEQLIKAYGRVRIGAQKRYARYLTKDTGAFTTHPATQRSWLHSRGIALLLAIFLLHLIGLTSVAVLHVSTVVTKSIHVLAVVLALSALGLRAIEDGLRPSEHLGRITGYLAEVSSIEEAYWETDVIATKCNLMIALEKAAYKEMVDFLQAGDRSQYIM